MPSKVRTREPFRGQGIIRFEMPEDTLPRDHRARLVWKVVETLDLAAFTATAKAVEGHQGRPLTSVRMLLTLWLYGISIGVGSAREIARRTTSDVAFQWIAGEEKVCHSLLSEFRVGHAAAMSELFTNIGGVLLAKQLLSLDRVAQDGTRIRASASAPSFRREASLEECRDQAALHVKGVLAEADDPEATAAEKRARLTGALDYQRRVAEALETVQVLQEAGKVTAKRRGRELREARASTTDVDARVMKMADGGYRPGYNIQMATAGSPLGGPRTIVAVIVTNVGSDMGSVTPMLEQIKERMGHLPKQLLADANHASHDCIRRCATVGVEALIAVPERSQNPSSSNADQDEAIRAWRERMQTPGAKQAYRARASLCELSNAHLKQHHGVTQVLVRGLAKVTTVALLACIAANVVQHATSLLG
jgi:transposase